MVPSETAASDWSKFDVCLRIEADADQLFEAWSTARGLASFFIETAVFISADGTRRAPEATALPGDRYEWQFIHGTRLSGTVQTVVAPKEFRFSFGQNFVTVRLLPARSGTLVHLRQDAIADSAEGRATALSCRAAWAHFLTVLKVLLEHGIDTRDHDPATAGSFSIDYRPRL